MGSWFAAFTKNKRISKLPHCTKSREEIQQKLQIDSHRERMLSLRMRRQKRAL
jgi:hypothetical protein